ncbi:unnamed protein product [Albugo candida]|uniref:Uncharacterized protein n=1 Tax=Albugo candida TaxID=65357 RepID=A0A024G1Z0_9STRA|nr:unnamed protein product [Albugo candida]|eukprot:CCI40680.1 unnamed protein product [Albugo candida]
MSDPPSFFSAEIERTRKVDWEYDFLHPAPLSHQLICEHNYSFSFSTLFSSCRHDGTHNQPWKIQIEPEFVPHCESPPFDFPLRNAKVVLPSRDRKDSIERKNFPVVQLHSKPSVARSCARNQQDLHSRYSRS